MRLNNPHQNFQLFKKFRSVMPIWDKEIVQVERVNSAWQHNYGPKGHELNLTGMKRRENTNRAGRHKSSNQIDDSKSLSVACDLDQKLSLPSGGGLIIRQSKFVLARQKTTWMRCLLIHLLVQVMTSDPTFPCLLVLVAEESNTPNDLQVLQVRHSFKLTQLSSQ